MKKLIHIACASDNKYVQHTGVMLTSLFENNKNNKIFLHFFSAEFDEENVFKLEKIAEKYNQRFCFYKLKSEDFKDCFISNHLTFATYYKIIIPLFVAKITDKILYLDTDIIVCNDLKELWNISLDHHIIGGVNDTNFESSTRLNFPTEYNYFNAGVLLLNCRLWVEENLSQTLFDYIKLYSSKLNFHEQDALNANIKGNWLRLSPKWNQMSILFEQKRNELLRVYSLEEIKEAVTNPAIIHYSGTSKPWDFLNIHPNKKKYFEYLRLTEWKNYTPERSIKDKFKFFMLKIIGRNLYSLFFSFFR